MSEKCNCYFEWLAETLGEAFFEAVDITRPIREIADEISKSMNERAFRQELKRGYKASKYFQLGEKCEWEGDKANGYKTKRKKYWKAMDCFRSAAELNPSLYNNSDYIYVRCLQHAYCNGRIETIEENLRKVRREYHQNNYTFIDNLKGLLLRKAKSFLS